MATHKVAICVVSLLALIACASPSSVEEGVASFYADSLHGNDTASGEAYDKSAYTAAHNTLPFGTRVRVTNLENQKSVDVRINDRGPYHGGRIIDISRAAAQELGMAESGTARVRLEIFD